MICFDCDAIVEGNIADFFIVVVVSHVAIAGSGGIVDAVLINVTVAAVVVVDAVGKGKREPSLATGLVLLVEME